MVFAPRLIILLISVLFSVSFGASGAIYYSQASNVPFNEVSTWNTSANGAGAAPNALDFTSGLHDFVIQNDHNIEVHGDFDVNDLLVDSGQLKLSYTGASENIVRGTLTISSAGSTQMVNNGIISSLTVQGDVIIDGTFDLYRDANDYVDLILDATSPGTISGDGDFDLWSLTVSAGSSTITANTLIASRSLKVEKTLTLNDSLIINGDLTIEALGKLNAVNQYVAVTGSWINNGGIFNGVGGTVILNGPQNSLIVGAAIFDNLTISRVAATSYYIDGQLNVMGDLVIENTGVSYKSQLYIGKDSSSSSLTVNGDVVLDDNCRIRTNTSWGQHSIELNGNVLLGDLAELNLRSTAESYTNLTLSGGVEHAFSASSGNAVIVFNDIQISYPGDVAKFDAPFDLYGEIDIPTGASLELNPGAGITFYGDGVVNNLGGTIALLGDSSKSISLSCLQSNTITQSSSNSRLRARYVKSHGCGPIQLFDGELDSIDNFRHSVFSAGTGYSYLNLMNFNSGDTVIIDDVTFFPGPIHNVVADGAIEPMLIFSDAIGDFAGSDFEADPGDKILWTTGSLHADNFIEGVVHDVNDTLESGEVVLIKRALNGKWHEQMRTEISDMGTYSFSDVPTGDYVIVSHPDTFLYPSLIPTFHANAVIWESAEVIYLAKNDSTTLDLKVNGLPFLQGTGKVSGRVFHSGFDKTTGDPIPGLDVVLVKIPPSSVVGHTTTNSSGYFEFTGVETGNYEVTVNIPGLKHIGKYSIVIDEETNATTTEVNFFADSTSGIYTQNVVTDVVDARALEWGDFLDGENFEDGSITLYDLSGRVVTTVESNNMVLESILGPGIYIAQWSFEGRTRFQSIIVRN